MSVLKRTPEEKAALAAARKRHVTRVVTIMCIFIGGIGIVGLKLGVSELWREFVLRQGAITTTATALEWQSVRGRSMSIKSCSVSYLFRTRNGDMAASHNDVGLDFLKRDGFTFYPCSGSYGSKTIFILYSEADPQVNRALEQPAIKHGVLFSGLGLVLLTLTYWQIWRRADRSKD
jgi:hypothetical protein